MMFVGVGVVPRDGAGVGVVLVFFLALEPLELDPELVPPEFALLGGCCFELFFLAVLLDLLFAPVAPEAPVVPVAPFVVEVVVEALFLLLLPPQAPSASAVTIIKLNESRLIAGAG